MLQNSNLRYKRWNYWSERLSHVRNCPQCHSQQKSQVGERPTCEGAVGGHTWPTERRGDVTASKLDYQHDHVWIGSIPVRLRQTGGAERNRKEANAGGNRETSSETSSRLSHRGCRRCVQIYCCWKRELGLTPTWFCSGNYPSSRRSPKQQKWWQNLKQHLRVG